MTELIVIYTTSAFHCPWCVRAKELLNIYGYDFYEKDINVEPRYKEEFKEQGFKTVPQVFIGNKHIGGYETTKHYIRNKYLKDFREEKRLKILEELENIT